MSTPLLKPPVLLSHFEIVTHSWRLSDALKNATHAIYDGKHPLFSQVLLILKFTAEGGGGDKTLSREHDLGSPLKLIQSSILDL